MGRACIININNLGELIAEYLKSQGRVQDVEWGDGPIICLEFKDTLTITFDDLLEVHPLRRRIMQSRAHEEMARDLFNKYIQTEIIKTLRGGEVVEYVPREKITIRDTEKTAIISVRLTEHEKEALERLAKEMGVTVSEVVRRLVHEKIQILDKEEKNER
ncbi:MAG: DUF6290 family protein [Ignisphaera sp.]